MSTQPVFMDARNLPNSDWTGSLQQQAAYQYQPTGAVAAQDRASAVPGSVLAAVGVPHSVLGTGQTTGGAVPCKRKLLCAMFIIIGMCIPVIPMIVILSQPDPQL